MVPLASMFNHKPPPDAQTHWYYDEKKNGFVVKAIKDIKIGEEVYITYGD